MIDNMKVTAIIAAAGSSNRMKSSINKTFIKIDGLPVIMHTIDKFQRSSYVDEIVVAARKDEIDYLKNEILPLGDTSKVIGVVEGGSTRQETISNCLEFLPDDTDIVLTHDGARPFVHVETINGALIDVLENRAVVVGVPVKDTIKSVNDDGKNVVHITPKRSLLWAAQSPQVFFAEDLRRAYYYCKLEGIEGTDDSSLVEKLGIDVHMFLGTYDNIKLTTPEDLILAKLFLDNGEVK